MERETSNLIINLQIQIMKRIHIIIMSCLVCLGMGAQGTIRDRRVFNIDSSNGTIWVSTLRDLIAVDMQTGTSLATYQTDANDQDASIGCVHCAINGNVWVGTWGKGAYILEPDGQWRKNVYLSARDYVMAIEDDGENIWCGAAAYLARLDANGVLTGGFQCGDKLSSSNGIVYDIDIDSQGRVWLSEENTGLSKVEGYLMEHMEDYKNLPFRKGYLCNKIAVDEGNQCVWGITSTRHGLHCYDMAYTTVTTYTQAEGSLPVDTVWDVLVDKDGALWLASANGKLVKRQTDGTFKVFVADNRQNIGVLHEDDEGSIWCGTEKGHLLKFDGERFAADIDLFAHETAIKDIALASDRDFKAASANGQVTLQWPQSGGVLLRVDFHDASGKLVESVNHATQEEGRGEFAPKELRRGHLYLLKAYTGYGAYATKLIYQ